MHGILFLSKYFVFTEAETLSFAVLKGSGEEEDIHPDEDEKYPDKPCDELRYSDYDDTEQDKDNTDEIHILKNYGIKNTRTVWQKSKKSTFLEKNIFSPLIL